MHKRFRYFGRNPFRRRRGIRWHGRSNRTFAKAIMSRRERIPSWLATGATAAVLAAAIRPAPHAWLTQVCPPDIFLLAFTLASAALLLWPRQAFQTTIGERQ